MRLGSSSPVAESLVKQKRLTDQRIRTPQPFKSSVVFLRPGKTTCGSVNEQFAQARAKIAKLIAAGSYRKPIATQVVPATPFWKAEEYHQKYLEKRGMVSCHI